MNCSQRLTRLAIFSFVAATSIAALARDLPQPQAAGMDAAKLGEIKTILEKAVANNECSGAVVLVQRKGALAALEAVGLADIEKNQPMRADSIFRIASMTKPMAAVAVMLLVDEGKVSIDDPVSKHLPEFGDMWIVEEKTADKMTLRKPKREVTVRDILTHTGGLADAPPRVKKQEPSLEVSTLVVSQMPLQFEPGSQWKYCNPGINAAGRIVEVVSGKPFDEFFQERIAGPLGMTDTFFHPESGDVERIVQLYKKGDNGKLVPGEVIAGVHSTLEKKIAPFPAGGLYSTASDVAKFYQMMLHGGELNGKRLLSKDAHAALTKTQTGDIVTGFVPGMSFGLGFAVVKEPQGVTAMLSPGSYGHGGAYGTQSWADPAKEMAMILLIQRSGFGNGDGADLRGQVQQAAVAAIKE